MVESIMGARIRERRRHLGVTQAEMARRIGISASYLNLIERNKRRIAGPLLVRTAEVLGASLEDLDGAAERQLVETLNEIAHLPNLDGLEMESGATGEFIGRYPGWARAMVSLANSEQHAWQTARALSERLTHDPFLGETVHRMLSKVAAIRSAAEILVGFDNIDPEQRSRFEHIVLNEAETLTDIGEALATYFEKTDPTDTALTPQDEVETVFAAHDNHFAEIEEMAASIAGSAGGHATELDPGTGLSEMIDGMLDAQPKLETATARRRAEKALFDYAARARTLPLDEFTAKSVELGYDLDLLAQAFRAPVADVCRRLTALAPGPGVPRFGYLQVNASGTITELLELPGLVVPRFSGACPLWVLYRAQQMPETVMRQRVLFPNGTRFIFIARSRSTEGAGFGKPRHFVTDMLVMTEADAAHTVYAPDEGVPVEEVGPACRLCARHACKHRVDDPLTG